MRIDWLRSLRARRTANRRRLTNSFGTLTFAQAAEVLEQRQLLSGTGVIDPREAPANDNFANSIEIVGSSATVNGTNIDATRETGEPLHAGQPGHDSVWWKWTAPTSGMVSIDTFGSVPDTLLAVYTGTAVNALTHIASNDDFDEEVTSKVTFNAVAGTTYHIAVDGLQGDADALTLHLDLAVPKPEIAVTGSGEVNIADGDTTSDATDGTQFGSVVHGATPPERSFTVRNDGPGVLNIGAVTIPEGYEIVDGLPATIAAGSSDVLTVRMLTDVAGVKAGQISIANDDPNEGPFNFAITGEVTGIPDITVFGNDVEIIDGDTTPSEGDHTAFGTMAQGSVVRRTYTIRNDGTGTLVLSNINIPGWLQHDDLPEFNIAAGASDTFTVLVDTRFVQVGDGEIKFTSNDPDEEVFNFAVSGTIVGAPEVAVFGNSIEIVDGDATPTPTDHTDFGAVTVGGVPVERTFEVKNTGSAALNLGIVKLPAGFTLVEPLSSTIAAGASDTFTVRLDTATAGIKSGHLNFTTNDGSEPLYNFLIRGAVDSTPPTAVATLPAVTKGGGTTYTFSVKFMDNVAIDVSTLDDLSAVIVTGPKGFHQAAQFVSVSLNSNGTPRYGTFTITPPGGSWNSADNGTYTVTPGPGIVKDTAGNALPATSIGSLVINLNDPPVLNVGTDTPTYTENDAPLRIAAAATVADVDSPNFDGGKLTVKYLSGAEANDRLVILPSPGGSPIGVTTNAIQYGGTEVATFAGGKGAGSLVITFNANATRAIVQAILSRIAYQNVSEKPGTTSRSFNITLTDGDNGGTASAYKTLHVKSVNDKPILTPGSAIPTYRENGAPLLISSNATAADVDSADFHNGKLTVGYVSGGEPNDRLTILHQGNGAGQVGVSGTILRFGGLIVGSIAGGVGAGNLVVTFNSAATLPMVQAVVRRVAYHNVSDNPSTAPRLFRFSLSDGDGGTSDVIQKSMNVTAANDAPIVGLGTNSPIYSAGSPPTVVAPSGTVADPDSANFQNGKLTISYASGGESNDRLLILNQGTGAGQVGVSNGALTYGGVSVGTFIGGIGAGALQVTFNANATAAAVRAVLRRIAYSSVSATPGTQTRVLNFVLTDGDGGMSAAVQKHVTVTAPAGAAGRSAADGIFASYGEWADA